jgi:NADPH:quinone reductase-like Zn-dependent oxidoreductase
MTLPAKMLALVQNESGYATGPDGPELRDLAPYLTAKEIDVPQPGEGEVLVRVKYAPVNPSDVMFIKGMYGRPRVAGSPAGFEGMGEVVACGDDSVAKAFDGKRVAFGAGRSGTWGEYALASASGCIPLRSDVLDQDGAALIVNPLTAYAMFDIVRQEGAKSFIMTAGASQLCKLIAGMAREEGFAAISIVRRNEHIDRLKELGAAHVLNSEADDFKATLRSLLREQQPRIFLDAVTGVLASSIFNEMGSGGRWIIYGRLAYSPTAIIEPGQMIFQEKRIEGFWLTSWMRTASTKQKIEAGVAVQEKFASGAWRTDIAAEIPFREAHARLPQALAGANTGKVFLTP